MTREEYDRLFSKYVRRGAYNPLVCLIMSNPEMHTSENLRMGFEPGFEKYVKLRKGKSA